MQNTRNFDMKRPSPVPMVDIVANLVNSIGNISESMPEPVSDILTTISSLLDTTVLVILTVPSFVNLILDVIYVIC
jgi:hypothetical protein